MAFVIAFAFSSYSSTCERVKKPFNPLLGETYTLNYKDKNKEFHFFSEQVSHHPPISAFVCKNKNYTVNGNVGISMKFWGKSLEFSPTGYIEIKLHTYNEVYTYNRGVSSIENILMGTPYIDHGGEMKFTNKSLGYKASIKLKKRGWTGYDAYKGQGKILDPKKNVVYKIKAKWNASMLAIDA